MLDLPGLPVLDKTRLIGGCLRLRLQIDAAQLRQEIDALPPALWSGTGGRKGEQHSAEAIFLRGYAPAEGDKPIEDRPALALLPYAKSLITGAFGAAPLRCLLARLPPGHVIATHADRALYFSKTLRVHLPVITCDRVVMYSVGLVYRMRPGEAWLLNNSDLHGVWNASDELARVHVICDFAPTPALLDLLAHGERGLGVADEAITAHFAAAAHVQ